MRTVIETMLAFLPSVLCMYLLFWLESSGTWTTETPHRDKYSFVVLAIGMGLSFLVYSLFNKKAVKE